MSKLLSLIIFDFFLLSTHTPDLYIVHVPVLTLQLSLTKAFLYCTFLLQRHCYIAVLTLHIFLTKILLHCCTYIAHFYNYMAVLTLHISLTMAFSLSSRFSPPTSVLGRSNCSWTSSTYKY